MSDDEDSGEEYVVFLEDGNDSGAEDHTLRGFSLYAEGEVELNGRVEAAFPFGETLMKCR